MPELMRWGVTGGWRTGRGINAASNHLGHCAGGPPSSTGTAGRRPPKSRGRLHLARQRPARSCRPSSARRPHRGTGYAVHRYGFGECGSATVGPCARCATRRHRGAGDIKCVEAVDCAGRRSDQITRPAPPLIAHGGGIAGCVNMPVRARGCLVGSTREQGEAAGGQCEGGGKRSHGEVSASAFGCSERIAASTAKPKRSAAARSAHSRIATYRCLPFSSL